MIGNRQAGRNWRVVAFRLIPLTTDWFDVILKWEQGAESHELCTGEMTTRAKHMASAKGSKRYATLALFAWRELSCKSHVVKGHHAFSLNGNICMMQES